MEYNNDNLTKRIMRRIYAIWFMRKAGPVLFLEMPILMIILLRESAREFFWGKIIDNFSSALSSPNGVMAAPNFVGSALSSAPVLSLIIIGFSAGLLAVSAYKLMRNFKQITLVRI